MIDFDTFTKIAHECGRFGQINFCQRLEKVAQSPINCPILSHCITSLKFQVQDEIRRGSPTAYLPREQWDTWDPMLISEGLFAAANIFSNLKLVYIFSVNPYLGPLQVRIYVMNSIWSGLGAIP